MAVLSFCYLQHYSEWNRGKTVGEGLQENAWKYLAHTANRLDLQSSGKNIG